MSDPEDISVFEFWEASQALSPLYDISKISPENLRRMNESMLADICGDNPISPPPSNLSETAIAFLYAIQSIYSSVRRFENYERMFRRYPWRGAISKSDHLQSVYYLFAHECYIFEERLKKYFKAAGAYAKTKNIVIDLKRDCREVIGLHSKAFGTLVRWRGTHVHTEEFLPRDIRRIGLIETQALVYGLRDKEAIKSWTAYRDMAVREVRRQWVGHCLAAQKHSEQIAIQTFRRTKPIWLALSKEA